MRFKSVSSLTSTFFIYLFLIPIHTGNHSSRIQEMPQNTEIPVFPIDKALREDKNSLKQQLCSNHFKKNISLRDKLLRSFAAECAKNFNNTRLWIYAACGSWSLATLHFYFKHPTSSYSIWPCVLDPSQRATLYYQDEWSEAESAWESLNYKMIQFKKEITPLLHLAYEQATLLLLQFYIAQSKFIHAIRYYKNDPLSLALSAKMFEKRIYFFSKEIDQINQESPICSFSPPSEEYRKSLIACQQELSLWEKEKLVPPLDALNIYIEILNAKIRYLKYGLDGKQFSTAENHHWVSLLNLYIKELEKMRTTNRNLFYYQ